MKKPLFKTLMLCTLIASTAACQHYDKNDPLARADKDMRQVLDAQAKLNPKPIELLTPKEARFQPSPADGVKEVLKSQGKDPYDNLGVYTKDIMIDGANGKIKARTYTPNDGKVAKLLPIIVYYHGGGFVISSIDTYDASARILAKEVNAVVISVDYRLAPEYKFPAAHNDAYAAYKWVLTHAQSISGDAGRVALVGESAGGNLALNTAIAARDNNVQRPSHLALIYPLAGTNLNTQSYQQYANAKPLNKPMIEWFVKHALPAQKDLADPRIDIIGNADLHNLPSTTIVTAEIDPLRTDGELLAQKLAQSGVQVDLKQYEGVTHEFFGMGAVVADAKTAEKDVAKNLATALR